MKNRLWFGCYELTKKMELCHLQETPPNRFAELWKKDKENEEGSISSKTPEAEERSLLENKVDLQQQ